MVNPWSKHGHHRNPITVVILFNSRCHTNQVARMMVAQSAFPIAPNVFMGRLIDDALQ